jgi:hypothetical protein
VPTRPRGRPRLYCSRSCQAKAYRRRQAEAFMTGGASRPLAAVAAQQRASRGGVRSGTLASDTDIARERDELQDRAERAERQLAEARTELARLRRDVGTRHAVPNKSQSARTQAVEGLRWPASDGQARDAHQVRATVARPSLKERDGNRDETPAPAAPSMPRHRPMLDLGPGWTTTDDSNRVTLWQRGQRVGSVTLAGLGSGWTAHHPWGGPVTTGASRVGRYQSRIKALRALAAEHEFHRRRITQAAGTALDGAVGWRLTQTLADRDEHTWRIIAPHGTCAGTVRRGTHRGATAWTAFTGDPASPRYAPCVIHPGDGDPQQHPSGDWRTRTAAARAIAAAYEPGPHAE